MKTVIRLLAVIILTMALSAATGVGADVPILVGDYGQRSALVIEGNQTFTTERILGGMERHSDYQIAAHPTARLANFILVLERTITLGYHRAGFPSVTVKAAADTNKHCVIVQVQEGPRFRCGDIILSGVPTMTNDMVRRKIVEVLKDGAVSEASLTSAGWRSDDTNPDEAFRRSLTNPDNKALQTNSAADAWFSGQPAPLDEIFRKVLTNQIREALIALNHLQARFGVEVIPDPERNVVDLKINIADEGIKGAVAGFEVNGLRTNTRAEILDYLKLRPGMDFSPDLATAISNQLWLSARFFRQEVSLVPLSFPGQFKLTLDLEEVPEAPPLSRELSPNESALLKFRAWLANWEQRPEDLVASISLTNSSGQGSADLVLSPAGTAFAVWDAVANSTGRLQYAFVASQKLIGLYSVWRKCKFTMSQAAGCVVLKVRPASPKSYGTGGLSFQVHLGDSSRQPLDLEIELQPAVFLSMAHWMDSSLKEGVLTLISDSDGDRQEIRIDAATGRLLQATYCSGKTNSLFVQLHPKAGAFIQLNKEIAAMTASYPNRYATNLGFASWLSFMVADFLNPPLIERTLNWFDPGVLPTWSGVAKLALAREILKGERLDHLFDPLNRLFDWKADNQDEETFPVPWDDDSSRALADSSQSFWFLWDAADALAPRHSWPWVLVREFTSSPAVQHRYMRAQLDKLLKSEDVGPVGCLAAAYLAAGNDRKLARSFAERGLARLNLAEFRRDYQLLLRTNFIVGDLVGNALGLLDGVNEVKLSPFLPNLSHDEAAFLQQVIRSLAGAKGKGQPPGDIVWPAFEQYWEKVPRRYLEMGLNQFLPQAQFLTSTQALFDRGRSLIAPDGSLIDPEEAIQCYRKAAELGHAQAQVSLGHFYEAGQGVPKDYAEALRWYRKAAEQKGQHALCSIGVMYQFGKGVPQDLDEAATWYRRELTAKDDCICAQENLGQIFDTKSNPEEALKWYRLAAAGGGGWFAQSRLGDMLSDGLSTKSDYVEACQWLSLAAAAGDKLSEIRLRRVKAKLTAEQWSEVERRVATISQQLKEKEKADAKATNP